MEILNIIKGSIRNIVSKEQFDKLYKPNGWKIDDSIQTQENDIDLVKTENELKNLQKMKKVKSQVFDDKLFYSEIKEG